VPKPEESLVNNEGRTRRNTARLNDTRSLRSQEALRNALLSLIEDHAFDKITIRDITSEARVSYPTFFNHYDSKDALFQDIARKEIVDFIAKGFRRGLESAEWRPGEGICTYISERRGLWRTLLTAGASEVMRSEYIRYGRDLASDSPGLGHGIPIDVVSGVVASGTFEIIAWWLAQDPDYPTATVANMLETLVIEPALNFPPGSLTSRKGLSG
jgi:AcrR family transcriptional regulator